MSLATWAEALTTQHGAGTSFASYTTAKSVINPQALISLPAGFFTIGKKLRITARGGLGTLVTTPGTVTFQVMVGSSIAFTTAAIQLNATAHVNLPFKLVVDLTCRAEGSGTNANAMGMAEVMGMMFTNTIGQTDGANTMAMLMAPATAPAVGAGFDSTIANVLDLWAGFSVNNAANTIKVEDYYVEALN